MLLSTNTWFKQHWDLSINDPERRGKRQWIWVGSRQPPLFSSFPLILKHIFRQFTQDKQLPTSSTPQKEQDSSHFPQPPETTAHPISTPEVHIDPLAEFYDLAVAEQDDDVSHTILICRNLTYSCFSRARIITTTTLIYLLVKKNLRIMSQTKGLFLKLW